MESNGGRWRCKLHLTHAQKRVSICSKQGIRALTAQLGNPLYCLSHCRCRIPIWTAKRHFSAEHEVQDDALPTTSDMPAGSRRLAQTTCLLQSCPPCNPWHSDPLARTEGNHYTKSGQSSVDLTLLLRDMHSAESEIPTLEKVPWPRGVWRSQAHLTFELRSCCTTKMESRIFVLPRHFRSNKSCRAAPPRHLLLVGCSAGQPECKPAQGNSSSSLLGQIGMGPKVSQHRDIARL